ncbi:MAG: ATP-binding protein [Ignavibacteriae bacterium]|nr:ATP-binding protein [Ignavibacteriota bacterium]MCB0725228.1 ATP-binding protein [Ignavibacteriota bacterium]MCB9242448.1 ATP-binding protein [Ignavibacteriales bacterium]
MDNSIVPAHLAVKAMRDNGYKNAAYALAELMDNSIQHKAKNVELLCLEKDENLSMRTVSRINKIAVLDNGEGMSSETLRMALQFGNGTHLEKNNQKGIGKFGMGLPSSSISQAKRVEVWTWQNGVENAIYSYLDIDEILDKSLVEVPKPIKKPIPNIWEKVGENFINSGTLVVWSTIDKCVWKTGKAIMDNSELLIGRMYRKYLADKKVKIRMVTFNERDLDNLVTRVALPNDPMYLMKNTSCPEPYNNEPMFVKWGDESSERIHKVFYNGETYEVKVRYSIAKKEAREGHNPGDRPYGKHAAKNIGISIMRAGRELDLDQSFVIHYDTRERWWGIEIEFPPALDEIFGVTNNKQFANNFSDLGKVDFEEMLKTEGLTMQQFKDKLNEENDPKSLLIDIVEGITTNLSGMRAHLKTQRTGSKSSDVSRYGDSPEKRATEATEERKQEGHFGTSDEQETMSDEEKEDDIKKSLMDDGVDDPAGVFKTLFKNDLKYSFVDADVETPAFFTVKSRGGKIIISLNVNHPAYHKLVEVLSESTESASEEELKERLENASSGLKLLLMAWGRYEDEQPDGNPKNRTQEARQDWGRIAEKFLNEE